MCMILKDSDADKHTAETDIIVYKVVNKISDNKYESIFVKYVYEKDKVNNGSISIRTAMTEGQPNTRTVDEGFHSYKRLGDAKFDYYIRKIHNFPNAVIIKCIIPKGSAFYNGFQRIGIGANGSTIVADQYVSDKIIVKEELKT